MRRPGRNVRPVQLEIVLGWQRVRLVIADCELVGVVVPAVSVFCIGNGLGAIPQFGKPIFERREDVDIEAEFLVGPADNLPFDVGSFAPTVA